MIGQLIEEKQLSYIDTIKLFMDKVPEQEEDPSLNYIASFLKVAGYGPEQANQILVLESLKHQEEEGVG